ncbi:hypothetical protein EDD37DRAFT_143688 [Exophiala viscosa]|uniref:Uncharacterized protein n=1 Tax=Exophiala viscosa TaxID=2486360 RepID=A0AAN6I9K7_9EURO|nr:hypothetical protein EDD36DRAFT_87245 [Exophiala viscosa]KAI1621074.1 hypothetical protein EDD37DRAFT_143688 [Exophiala viscosa]
MVISALLFPTTGVVSSILALRNLPILAKTSLRTAARAGALCTVVYESASGRESGYCKHIARPHGRHTKATSPRNRSASTTHSWQVQRATAGIRPCASAIQGEIRQHPEPEKQHWYQELRKMFESLFEPSKRSHADATFVVSNYSLVKILAAVGQSLYGIATLYDTRGDQLNRYGYSAFGLTVIPYAYISLVNLVANLLCPEYPAMYLVESQAMRDAMEISDKREELELASFSVAAGSQHNPGSRPCPGRQSDSASRSNLWNPPGTTTQPDVVSQPGPGIQVPSTAQNVAAPLGEQSANRNIVGQVQAHSAEHQQSSQQAQGSHTLALTEVDATNVARLVPSKQRRFTGVVGALDDEWVLEWHRRHEELSVPLLTRPVWAHGDIEAYKNGQKEWPDLWAYVDWYLLNTTILPLNLLLGKRQFTSDKNHEHLQGQLATAAQRRTKL